MILELERPLVFIDLETTGLDPDNDRIVEIGLLRLCPDGRRDVLCERVDPGVDIPDTATRVHRIATAEVRGLFGRPRLNRVAQKLVDFIGDADLAGFNSSAFDLPLWRKECARHGVCFSDVGRRALDAKIIFHSKETGWDRFLMGPRDLSAAVRHYCGRELADAHSAAADVQATAEVLLAQLTRYTDLPRTVPGLHDYCESIRAQVARMQ